MISDGAASSSGEEVICLFFPWCLQRWCRRRWTDVGLSLRFILFFQHVHGVRRRNEEEPGGGQTTWRCGRRWGHASLWFGPLGAPPTSPLRLFIPPDAKTLKHQVIFPEEFRSAAAIDDKFRGTEVSVPARRRDGELPPESSPSTPPPSSSPLLTPMMRRE